MSSADVAEHKINNENCQPPYSGSVTCELAAMATGIRQLRQRSSENVSTPSHADAATTAHVHPDIYMGMHMHELEHTGATNTSVAVANTKSQPIRASDQHSRTYAHTAVSVHTCSPWHRQLCLDWVLLQYLYMHF